MIRCASVRETRPLAFTVERERVNDEDIHIFHLILGMRNTVDDIFWGYCFFLILHANTPKRNCLQFPMQTRPGSGGERGVVHILKNICYFIISIT